MFHPLRVLDARTAAEDAAMLAAGYQVEPHGRWARTYRLDPAYAAARRELAERERVARMGRAAEQLHAVAFPRQHADLLARQAAEPMPAPARTVPVALDRLAAALTERIDPQRVVFERLTIERGQS